MAIERRRAMLCVSTAWASLAIGLAPAHAQDASSAPAAPATVAAPATPTTDAALATSGDLGPGDIIVTARKRQETLLKVPVIETALPKMQLERLQTADLKNVATLVPGLLVGNQLLSIGTQVSIRGIGTSSSDPGVDQSVALNIDGLQLGSGLAYASGMFDLGQIEVLKGPQALFFGKTSPGGVISLTTSDPTDKFELIARGSYEFEAQEKRGELIVSGPVTDTIKARLAGMYSASRGYFRNDGYAEPGTGAEDPRYSHGPRDRSYIVRGTVLWNPDPAFSARLKANVSRDRADNADAFQYKSCPEGQGAVIPGLPFIGGGEDCKINRHFSTVDMDPNAFPALPGDGTPFVLTKQQYGTLELNYRPTKDITLTSVTGLYHLDSRNMVNAIETTYAGTPLAVDNHYRRHDLTEELRLNSDFSSPLNFTLGGFYEDGRVNNIVTVHGNEALLAPALYGTGIPLILQKGQHIVNMKTYSGFGQLRYKIVPTLELAAGARYTDETRTDTTFDLSGATKVETFGLHPRVHSSNVAPEVTLTWTPTNDLTVFGAYKKGYKSGSFSIATPLVPGRDNSFGDEKVEGGEVGLKARLFDRSLSINLAGYRYIYTGLQVGAVEPPDPLAGIIIRTVNAGSAKVYGLDFDAAYRPPSIEGLSLHGSVNWNHARFTKLDNVPCYGGQTIAAGCTELPFGGVNTAQNLKGSRLVRAPNWQVNFGADYELPVGRNMKLILTSSNQYSSRYVTFLSNRPDAFQSSYLKADLSLTLQGANNRWDVALIGKNITNKITSSACVSSNNQAGVIFPGTQVTGGTGVGPAGIDEIGCFVDRGRELVLRLTLRPFN